MIETDRTQISGQPTKVGHGTEEEAAVIKKTAEVTDTILQKS